MKASSRPLCLLPHVPKQALELRVAPIRPILLEQPEGLVDIRVCVPDIVATLKGPVCPVHVITRRVTDHAVQVVAVYRGDTAAETDTKFR
jgi:hypothetical protein